MYSYIRHTTGQTTENNRLRVLAGPDETFVRTKTAPPSRNTTDLELLYKPGLVPRLALWGFTRLVGMDGGTWAYRTKNLTLHISETM